MPVELTWPGKSKSLQRGILPAAGTFVRIGAGVAAGASVRMGLDEGSTPVIPDARKHHVIAGDAFEALGLLAPAFAVGVDVIYIDPPYNTGRSFTYRDKWHDGDPSCGQEAWLDFLAPILVRARELLSPRGVMFISIDDHEYPALSLLVREIFGAANHLGTIKWKRKRKPSFLGKHFSPALEYVLIIAKEASACPRLLGPHMEEKSRPVLNASNPEGERVLRAGMPARCPDGIYRAGPRTNRTLELVLLGDAEVRGGVLVREVPVRGRFRVSQAILDRSCFITPRFGLRRSLGEEEWSRKAASDFYPEWPTNEDAESELRARFGERVFDFPKPVGLLRALIGMVPPVPGRRMRCLDFFGGSGTFAEAVLTQSAEDGIARHFTLVQLPEPISGSGVGKRFHTIADLAMERARLAGIDAGLAEGEIEYLRIESGAG